MRLHLAAVAVAAILTMGTGWDCSTLYQSRLQVSTRTSGVLMSLWLLSPNVIVNTAAPTVAPTMPTVHSLFTSESSSYILTRPMSLGIDGQSSEDLTTLTQQYGPWCGHTAIR